MKKLILFIITQVLILNLSLSQSAFSILGKAGGQLIQDLSKKNEWRAVGKALETASDRKYEMERIKAENTQVIITKTESDNVERAYPTEGYTWTNPENTNDFSVRKITEIDRDSFESANKFLQTALNCFNSGDLDGAMQYCNASIEKEETWEIYLLRALVYTKNKSFENALEDLGNMLNFKLEPEKYNFIFVFKGEILLNKQDNEEAIDELTKCINSMELSNDLLECAYTDRGSAKINIGQNSSAILDFNKCIELNSDSYIGYINRGVANLKLENNNGAAEDFSSGINLLLKKEGSLDENQKNSLSAAFTYRGLSKISFEDYQNALKDANDAIKWDNQYPQAYLARGIAKIKLGFKESGWSDIYKAKNFGLSFDEASLKKELGP